MVCSFLTDKFAFASGDTLGVSPSQANFTVNFRFISGEEMGITAIGNGVSFWVVKMFWN